MKSADLDPRGLPEPVAVAALAALLLGTAAAPASARAGLEQKISLTQVGSAAVKRGVLTIDGQGTAETDSGKRSFGRATAFSSRPAISVVVKAAPGGELQACQDRAQTARDQRTGLEIRGLGTFEIDSRLDSVVQTGVFTLTRLDACAPPETTEAATVSPRPAVAVSTSVIAAGDLVAAPELYVNRPLVITGRLASAPQFGEAAGRLDIESEGQRLACRFATAALAPESRLALVHAAPGTAVTLAGTLTHGAAGYEFEVSSVVKTE